MKLEPLTPETLLSIVVAQNAIGKAMMSSRDQIRFESERIEPIKRNLFTDSRKLEAIGGALLATGIGIIGALTYLLWWGGA